MNTMNKPRFSLVENDAGVIPITQPVYTGLKITIERGMKLTPIKWGKPDRALAAVICRHLVDVNEPTIIPFNPLKHEKLKEKLTSLGILAR